MRAFVYDDACGPCVRAARILTRRTAGRLEVLPFSRVRDRLDAGQARRFAREALYQEGPGPLGGPEQREAWGHAAVARALLASAHPVDRLLGRLVLAPGVRAVARRVYARVAARRQILGRALDLLGAE